VLINDISADRATPMDVQAHPKGDADIISEEIIPMQKFAFSCYGLPYHGG
jgi:hypothetical protein